MFALCQNADILHLISTVSEDPGHADEMRNSSATPGAGSAHLKPYSCQAQFLFAVSFDFPFSLKNSSLLS